MIFIVSCRELPLRNSGHSFNSSITWKTLPLPCKCTTMQVDQLDKVKCKQILYINVACSVHRLCCICPTS